MMATRCLLQFGQVSWCLVVFRSAAGPGGRRDLCRGAVRSAALRGGPAGRRPRARLLTAGLLKQRGLVTFWLAGTAHAPRSVALRGVVAQCTRAEYAAQGDTGRGQGPPVVTVFLQDQAGRTVAAQRLPFRVAGARYRMRVLAVIYTLAIVSRERG
jgi:hypothetical protein